MKTKNIEEGREKEHSRDGHLFFGVRLAIICFMLLFVSVGVASACKTYVYVNPGESIQDAIDSLCPEGGVVELAPGIWTINSTILINKNNVIFHGTGKNETVIDGSSGDDFDIILVRGPNATDPDPWAGPFPDPPPDPVYIVNVTIGDLTVRGSGPASGRPQDGIHIHEGWKIDIYNVRVEETPHVGIAIGYSNDIDMKNCDCYKTEGIRTFRTTKGTIVNCTSKYSDYCCIELNCGTHDFVIDNNEVYSCWGAGISVYGGSSNNIVSNNFVSSAITTADYAGISLFAARNTIVENNTCYGSKYGIALIPETYFGGNIIRNNLIYSNSDAGIYCYFKEPNNAYSVQIESNTIYSNGGDGIKNDLSLITLDTKNNIIVNNGGYGLYRNNGAITPSYNNIWNNTGGKYFGVSEGTGDISEDPLFADPDNGDFHLKSQAGRWNDTDWIKDNETSPCIDAGDPEDDYSNEPEPNGNRINIGAYGNTKEASKSPLTTTYLPPTPKNQYTINTWAYINVTTNNEANCTLEWNGINESFEGNISNTNFYSNKTDLNGNYSFKVYCNSYGSLAETEERWIYTNISLSFFDDGNENQFWVRTDGDGSCTWKTHCREGEFNCTTRWNCTGQWNCSYYECGKNCSFGTIQQCADVAQPGDICRVQAGIYNQKVEIYNSGNSTHKIIFIGDDYPQINYTSRPVNIFASYITFTGFNVTSKGDGIIVGKDWWGGKFCGEISVKGITVSNNYIDTVDPIGEGGMGIKVWSGSGNNSLIQNNTIYADKAAIIIDTGSDINNISIIGNKVWAAYGPDDGGSGLDYGIGFYGSNTVVWNSTISHNIIRQSGWTGMKTGCRNCVISYNDLSENLCHNAIDALSKYNNKYIGIIVHDINTSWMSRVGGGWYCTTNMFYNSGAGGKWNLYFANITVINATGRGFVVGGNMRNVLIKNLYIKNFDGRAIQLGSVEEDPYPWEFYSTSNFTFINITLENISTIGNPILIISLGTNMSSNHSEWQNFSTDRITFINVKSIGNYTGTTWKITYNVAYASNWHCNGIVYIINSNKDDISFEEKNNAPGRMNCSIIFYYYTDVYVKNENNNPINGAKVYFITNSSEVKPKNIDYTFPGYDGETQNITWTLTNSDGHIPLPSNLSWTVAIPDSKKSKDNITNFTTIVIANNRENLLKNSIETIYPSGAIKHSAFKNWAIVDPDSSWYRENPNTYQNTTVLTINQTFISENQVDMIALPELEPTTTTTSTSTSTSTTTTTSTSTSTTTTTIPGTTTTTVTTTTTIWPCDLPGDYPTCGEITLEEVVDFINLWVEGQAELGDVVNLINAWAGS